MTEGVARAGFDVDLEFGEGREAAFVGALRDCHVECKSDQKVRVTGNVAVEMRQGGTGIGEGRPSGLAVSTARWWAIEYEDDCWLVMRTSLLKAKTEAAVRAGLVRMVGDRNRYECALVPVIWLVQGWRSVSA